MLCNLGIHSYITVFSKYVKWRKFTKHTCICKNCGKKKYTRKTGQINKGGLVTNIGL